VPVIQNASEKCKMLVKGIKEIYDLANRRHTK
jgi:hypothetical protein